MFDVSNPVLLKKKLNNILSAEIGHFIIAILVFLSRLYFLNMFSVYRICRSQLEDRKDVDQSVRMYIFVCVSLVGTW